MRSYALLRVSVSCINDARLQEEQRMAVTNVGDNRTTAKENIDIAGNMNGITENRQQREETRVNGRQGMHLLSRFIDLYLCEFFLHRSTQR